MALILSSIGRTTFALLARRRPRTVISGIEVVQLEGEERETMSLFGKIQDALDLISRVDPVRFSRIRKDMRRVYIMGELTVAGRKFVGSSPVGLDGCFVDLAFLRAATVRSVAVLLVHEATHVRIDHSRVKQHPRMIDRIERVCRAAEISFARKLDDDEFMAWLLRWHRARSERG